jgi:hypothetical protein
MEIFKLIGSVMVDTADAEKSIQKTTDEAEGFGKKLSNGIQTAGKWAAGVAAGAAAVGAAMVKASKDTAEEMDAIDKGSQRMKISAQSYQELAHAAGLSGVEMSTLEKAAKKLEGTDLNLDDALDQIYSLGTAEERAAKASELFGDSVAYQMTPMLNASAEDMAAMRQEAHDLGLVMSDEAVANGAAMGDMFAKVEESLSALKSGLVAEFMPYVMEILQWIIDNIPQIRDTVKSVMDAILPIVKPIINAIMTLLPPIMEAVKRLMNWLLPFIKPIINAISSLVTGFTKLLNGDIEGFVNGIISFLTGIVKTFFSIGQNILGAVWDGIVNIWNQMVAWVVDKVNWLADKLAFWRKGNSEMSGNAHAGGLPYVPYDNYPALLHRGESVMTAADSQSLLGDVRKIAENGGGNGQPITIVVQSVLDGRVIGETVTKYQANKARAFA